MTTDNCGTVADNHFHKLLAGQTSGRAIDRLEYPRGRTRGEYRRPLGWLAVPVLVPAWGWWLSLAWAWLLALVAGVVTDQGTAAFAGDGPVLSAESFSLGCFPAPPTLPGPLTYFLSATPHTPAGTRRTRRTPSGFR